MSDIPLRVKNCTTHHFACECREYSFEQLKDFARELMKIVDIITVEGLTHITTMTLDSEGLGFEVFDLCERAREIQSHKLYKELKGESA